jgi:hypothetical protein
MTDEPFHNGPLFLFLVMIGKSFIFAVAATLAFACYDKKKRFFFSYTRTFISLFLVAISLKQLIGMLFFK